jgi:plastocyanin
MKLTALFSAALLSAGLCSVTASGQITGKVTIDGEPPQPQEINMASNAQCAAAHPNPVMDESIVVGDNGELANVVVSIKAPEGKQLKGDAPKEAAVVDQKGCQYVPHVVAMMVGQDLIFKNSDAFLHNVHSLALDNMPFNISQPNKDQKGINKGKDIKVTERFVVKCDVHPWMTSHVNAFEHPFFAVSNEKGEFSIPTKGLEDGTYTLEIWQEKLAPEPITQDIEVKGGKAKVEEIKIPATPANARADDADADVKLASAPAAPPQESCKTGACCAAKSKAQARQRRNNPDKPRAQRNGAPDLPDELSLAEENPGLRFAPNPACTRVASNRVTQL